MENAYFIIIEWSEMITIGREEGGEFGFDIWSF